jgi:hypothetical protein
MQGEKDKERAAQVVADFKIVFDKWYKKSRNLRVLQKELSNKLYNKLLPYEVKFEIINLVIFGLPKGLRSYREYCMLMDVGRKVDVWFDSAGLDPVQLDIAGGKILDYFRDVFRGLCAYQSLADDMHDDEIDDVVIKTAGETQKSYNTHLKRDARKQLRQEEDDDDEEENDEEDDDE